MGTAPCGDAIFTNQNAGGILHERQKLIDNTLQDGYTAKQPRGQQLTVW
jgi:hypothetical protein